MSGVNEKLIGENEGGQPQPEEQPKTKKDLLYDLAKVNYEIANNLLK